MKVICAGLPKTGTKSLASALRTLGYTVHDVAEHWAFHMDEYNQALESKKTPDFVAMYANVDAVTDLPASVFFKEIFLAFPDAKVILMQREDEEVWFRSYLKTRKVWMLSATHLWVIFGFVCTPTGRKWKRFLMNEHKNTWKSAVENDSNFKEVLKSVYREHNERVKSVIPRDKLLVYNVKQGWKPLCEFLGMGIPDVPFPRLNMNSEAIPDLLNCSNVGRRVFKESVFMLTVMVIVLAAFVFMLMVYH